MKVPVGVKITIIMRKYLVFIVGILVIISYSALAYQVNDNRSMPLRSGADLAAGFPTLQNTAQVTPFSTTTGPSATYPTDGAITRFKSLAMADTGDKGAVITKAQSAIFATVVDNNGVISAPQVTGRTTAQSTRVLPYSVSGPPVYGYERGATTQIPYTNAYRQDNVTKSNAISRDAGTINGRPPNPGSILLLNEAERQLARMTSSYYTHTTNIDEQSGTYNYDCSGFVGYSLARAVPGAFSVIGHKRPVAADFYDHIVQTGPTPDSGGWMSVRTPLELRPGDIIAWLKPDSSDSTSTGHVMIVAGYPAKNLDRKGEVLVQVIDSTESGHAGDTRGPGQTGLGKGTIGIMTGPSGLPTGYYWRGGESRLLQETEIVFARIA